MRKMENSSNTVAPAGLEGQGRAVSMPKLSAEIQVTYVYCNWYIVMDGFFLFVLFFTSLGISSRDCCEWNTQTSVFSTKDTEITCFPLAHTSSSKCTNSFYFGSEESTRVRMICILTAREHEYERLYLCTSGCQNEAGVRIDRSSSSRRYSYDKSDHRPQLHRFYLYTHLYLWTVRQKGTTKKEWGRT